MSLIDSEFGIVTTEQTGACETCNDAGDLRVVTLAGRVTQRVFLCDDCYPVLRRHCEVAIEMITYLLNLGQPDYRAIALVERMMSEPAN